MALILLIRLCAIRIRINYACRSSEVVLTIRGLTSPISTFIYNLDIMVERENGRHSLELLEVVAKGVFATRANQLITVGSEVAMDLLVNRLESQGNASCAAYTKGKFGRIPEPLGRPVVIIPSTAFTFDGDQAEIIAKEIQDSQAHWRGDRPKFQTPNDWARLSPADRIKLIKERRGAEIIVVVAPGLSEASDASREAIINGFKTLKREVEVKMIDFRPFKTDYRTPTNQSSGMQEGHDYRKLEV